MNARLGLAFVFLSLILMRSADLSAQSSWWVGIKAGPGSSKPSVSEDPPSSVTGVGNGVGPVIGAIVERRFSDMLSFDMEPTYVHKAFQLQRSTQIDQISIDYAEFSLLFRPSVRLERIGFFLVTGASLQLKLAEEYVLDPRALREGIELDDYFSSSDFGISFGGGIGYQVSSTASVILEWRTIVGITDISRYSFLTMRSREMRLMVGLIFRS
jgi:opacity protein-like surface antigen